MNFKNKLPAKALFLSLSVLLPSGTFAQAGALDLTFGTDGIVTTDISKDDYANAIAIQPDGKIVVAGKTYNVSFSSSDFAVIRYNSDGSLDNTFSTGGIVTADLYAWTDYGMAMAIQPDGKILVAGDCDTFFTFSDFAVIRFNSDGTLDYNFGTNGKVSTDFYTSGDFVSSMALQPDGKIVVVGTNSDINVDDNFALLRYNSNGTLDLSFGTDGKVSTDFNSTMDLGNDVAIQSDGKIVVAGNSKSGTNNDFAVARYNSDGSLDLTFDTDGKTTTPIGTSTDVGTSIAIQPDGKIVVAGFSKNSNDLNIDFALVRYNSDGSLDNTFDSDGKVFTPVGLSTDQGFALTLQPDGKIVVAGQIDNAPNESSSSFGVVRYNSNGSLDTGFGTGGKMTTQIGLKYDVAKAIAQQPDGKIVVAGYSDIGVNNDFAVVRYLGGLSSGINMLEHQSNPLKIYPNPFTSAATLKTDVVLVNATLSVYNAFGQQVKQIENISEQTITLHRDNLASGIYYLSLTQNNETIVTQKIAVTDN